MSSSDSDSPPPEVGASRRVAIIREGASPRNSFAERKNSPFSASNNLLPVEHHEGMGDFFAGRPGGMGDLSFFNGGDSGESLACTTEALDAVIMDLTRRRISAAAGPSPHSAHLAALGRGTRDAPPAWENTSSFSTNTASLASRQTHLQQQKQDLLMKQNELEMQRQQLMAGMQEHAQFTSMFAAQQHLLEQQDRDEASMSSCPVSPLSSQQWWVCQVCNTKAFASHDDAMEHELSCCPGPQEFEHMAASMSMSGDLLPRGAIYDSPVYPTSIGGSPVLDESGMDRSVGGPGPFMLMKESKALAMQCDKEWLTPLHCFVRQQCVEVFTASDRDISTPSKGKRKPIQVGQVGIRCPHCFSSSASSKGKTRERGSVYYPTSIASIYNATMNLLQRHLHNCSSVPDNVMRRFATLKGDDARSGTSKRYWIESSLSLGLIDTPYGIRYSALEPPPLPSLSTQQHSTRVERRNSNEFYSTKSNAGVDQDKNKDDGVNPPYDPSVDSKGDARTRLDKKKSAVVADPPTLVEPEDARFSTKFSFELMSHMQCCVFTEADRLGKRKGLPAGFPGLACQHCFGGFGSGRFFPSSIKTLSDTSKTLNVLYNHMMRCRKCPVEVRTTLETLRTTHDEERGKMKFGSQKAFFGKVWSRLHPDGNPGLVTPKKKRKKATPPAEDRHNPPTTAPALPPLTSSVMDPGYFGMSSSFTPPFGAPIGPSFGSTFGPAFEPAFGPAFGPSITMVAGNGSLSESNSFTGLDDALEQPDAPPSRKRKQAW